VAKALVPTYEHQTPTGGVATVDLDGIEFEVMWKVPATECTLEDDAAVRPLALESELSHWSGVPTA